MSKKTVDKLVSCCDLCGREDVETWKCGRCNRDACAECCHVFNVTREEHRWAYATRALFPGLVCAANFCLDCEEHDTGPVLRAAGFVEVPPREVSHGSGWKKGEMPWKAGAELSATGRREI